MATYYNGNPEIQGGDGLQTLVLMNPGYVNYSDHHQQPPQQPPQPSPNFSFLNNHHQTSLSHAPPQSQQFVGVPLPTVSMHSQHDISALHAFMPRVPYNMYSPAEMAASSHDVTRFQQGLSLTLSSQQPAGFGTPAGAGVQTVSPTGNDGRSAGDGTPSASGVSNSVLLNSKYLKATHELLEEVVNVDKGVFKNSDKFGKSVKTAGDRGDGLTPETGRNGEESSGKHGDGAAELTTAERHEVQMKKAKLVNMLDEVEQRYRQYHNQMQIVISWFEQAAGIGSAKTYTALALETISKQFRCLKDAILGQIKTASKSLGEDDTFGEGGSRLKFVDNQIRQQRALQQLGMIQHNAWRPQRGLPERSVSVLRAWLFEHFLHPYPKDSDKHMLAKQTGLTRSQVSNWFINARVRLWKPMVEEMYLEEVKEQEQNRSDENKATKSDDNSSSQHHKSLSPENPKRTISTSPPTTSLTFQNQNQNPSQMPGMAQFSPKKPRNNDTSDVGFTLMGNPTDFMGGLGGYPITPFSGNGVSLTLGLPHCDPQNFLPTQNINHQESNEYEPETMYETMNIQNQKRFADFVA